MSLVRFLSEKLFCPLRALGIVSSTDDGQKVEVLSPAHALALTENYSTDTLTQFVEQDNEQLIYTIIPAKVLPEYYQPAFAISDSEYPSWPEAQIDENDDEIDIKIDDKIEIPTINAFQIESDDDDDFMDMFNRIYQTDTTIEQLNDGR
jgi:hypothetical protein